MPLLPRPRHLPALAIACAATLSLGAGSAVAASPAHHHHRHVTKSRHHVAKAHHHVVRSRKVSHRTKSTTHKTTTHPTTPVTSTPVTTTPTPTPTPTPAPVTTTPTTPTTTAVTTPAPTVPTAPASPSGQILFQNSYPSSGNALNIATTGWTAAQYPSDIGVAQPDRLTFGPAPGASSDPNLPTTNVAHFQLQPYYTTPGVANGDLTSTGGYLANRVEVYARNGGSLPAASWPDPVGSTRWYSYSVYIPSGFPTSTASAQWLDFTQWKGLNSGSPPVAMEIRGTNFVLGGQNSSQTLGSIDPGTWTHFVIGLDFSDSVTTGWATVYVNGALIVNQVPTQTMNDATVNGVTGVDPDYLKMGIYRSKSWTVSQDLYLTPMTIGTTLASVS